MRPDDKRQTCVCGHRYHVHSNGGPCLASDTPDDQRTGQGCQCHEYPAFSISGPADDDCNCIPGVPHKQGQGG